MIGATFSQNIYREFEETKRQNIFEEVIDQMMVDNYLPEEFKGKIKELPLESKRRAIFTFIDENSHFVLNELDKLPEDTKLIDKFRTALQGLKKYIEVGQQEVKKFGEVFTPLELVEEMLDTLPKEVWSNPELKWLDPANGMGNFPLIVIKRLMVGLKSWESDPNKRYKHIVENMIYVCELQPRNAFMYLYLVDPHDIYDVNLYCGSFLDEGFDKHMKDVWDIEKFDIVMGNPPYQMSTSGGNGARDLWDKFVYNSIDLLNGGGNLTFVHPSKWRSPGHKCLRLFKKYNLKFLEIHSDSDGKRVFGANTRYDFYCIEKSNYGNVTKVIDEMGKEYNINLNEWDWIPNYNFELISTILNRDGDNLKVEYNSSVYDARRPWMNEVMENDNNLPCVYGMYKDGSVSYKYSSEDKGHFGIPKIILGLGRYLYPKIDINGEYGTMNNAFFIPIESIEHGDKIKRAIESDKFKKIIKSTKWSNFQVNWKMFKSFKKDFWKEFIDK